MIGSIQNGLFQLALYVLPNLLSDLMLSWSPLTCVFGVLPTGTVRGVLQKLFTASGEWLPWSKLLEWVNGMVKGFFTQLVSVENIVARTKLGGNMIS
jgi:hypothetical protein